MLQIFRPHKIITLTRDRGSDYCWAFIRGAFASDSMAKNQACYILT